jgi:hypothetical protein
LALGNYDVGATRARGLQQAKRDSLSNGNNHQRAHRVGFFRERCYIFNATKEVGRLDH